MVYKRPEPDFHKFSGHNSCQIFHRTQFSLRQVFYYIACCQKVFLFKLCFLFKNSIFNGKIKYKGKSAFVVKLIYLLTILLSLGLHANDISLCPLAAKIMNKHNSFANGTFLIYLTKTGNGHFENSALLCLVFILQQNMSKAGLAKVLTQLKKRHSLVGLNKCDREGRTRSSKTVICPYKPTFQSCTTGLNGVDFTKVNQWLRFFKRL